MHIFKTPIDVKWFIVCVYDLYVQRGFGPTKRPFANVAEVG